MLFVNSTDGEGRSLAHLPREVEAEEVLIKGTLLNKVLHERRLAALSVR